MTMSSCSTSITLPARNWSLDDCPPYGCVSGRRSCYTYSSGDGNMARADTMRFPWALPASGYAAYQAGLEGYDLPLPQVDRRLSCLFRLAARPC